MPSTVLSKSVKVLIPIGTSNAAGSTTRGTADLRSAQGGLLTVKLTNGATGPTVAATCNIMIAHTIGETPAAASRGADWKTIWSFTGSTANNAIVESPPIELGPGVMHVCVEAAGNTGQAVVCEALLSEITSAVSS